MHQQSPQFDLKSIAPSLRLDDEGIWIPSRSSAISYPEDGNSICFEVEESSYWFRHRNNLIKRLYAKYASGTRMYDIGGGNGIVTKYLSDHGESCVLVEPGRSGALNARRRGIENVVQSTLQDAGFLDGAIENVGLFDVVEHIQDDHLFLKDLGRYQKRGSLAFITVPSLRFLWSSEDTLAGHYRRYTKKSLETVLNSTGYDMFYCTYFFSFLVAPIFFVRTLPSMIGLRGKTCLAVAKREHSTSNSMVASVLLKATQFESERVMRGKSIALGSSLLAVARKR
ncbi:MAG: class I SAM-dependent methyltransferase [Planctomycetota bacterium]|jgi:hypothetical protein